MNSLAEITGILGWASVLNIGFLMLASLSLIAIKGTAARIHSKLFGIPEDQLALAYFKYLANYKIMTLVFFVAPYFALKIMGQ